MHADDGAILHASCAEPARFEAIFARHHDRIWRYLARLGGPACADELASEVFLVAFARRATYEPARGSVSSWLYGIATNLARTRARREGRAARAVCRLASETGAAVAAAGRTRTEDPTEIGDELARVRAALDLLPAAHREVLVLYAWEELPYQELARVLGVEVGTVRSRLARARAGLRELLAGSGEVLVDDAAPRTPHG